MSFLILKINEEQKKSINFHLILQEIFSSFTFKAIFITSYFSPKDGGKKRNPKHISWWQKAATTIRAKKTSPRAGILLIYLPLCRNFALKYILDCPLQSPHSATKIWLNNISRRMAKENGNKKNLSSIFHEGGKKKVFGVLFCFFYAVGIISAFILGTKLWI